VRDIIRLVIISLLVMALAAVMGHAHKESTMLKVGDTVRLDTMPSSAVLGTVVSVGSTIGVREPDGSEHPWAYEQLRLVRRGSTEHDSLTRPVARAAALVFVQSIMCVPHRSLRQRVVARLGL
jgi:hypothetical protein